MGEIQRAESAFKCSAWQKNWIHKWKKRWRDKFFLRVVAILNASPRDPRPGCYSLRDVLREGRGMDYWELAPSSQYWLCKTRRPFLWNGESSSGISHRQAMQGELGPDAEWVHPHRGTRWWARLVRPELGQDGYDCIGFSPFKITTCGLELRQPV